MAKRSDIVRELEQAGFSKRKSSGSQCHDKYVKQGFPPIAVPRHKEINEITARHIRKGAGL